MAPKTPKTAPADPPSVRLPLWLVPMLVTLMLATGGSALNLAVRSGTETEKLDSIITRMDVVEHKLDELHGLDSRISVLEQQLRDLRERVTRCETSRHGRAAAVDP
jgi:hypothetical protein